MNNEGKPPQSPFKKGGGKNEKDFICY